VRLRRVSLAVAAAVVGAGLTAAAAPVTSAAAVAAPYAHATRATTTQSAPADPASNVAPTPDYWPVCSASGANSQICIDAVVSAINHARSLEGVAPMVLPAGFASMSTAVQTFVVSNLERADRGLRPATGMVGTLDSLSVTAAGNDADPVLPDFNPIGPFNPNRWGSNWAGDLNALAADYDWMYDDGWGPNGSYNLDCPNATASGCWGHRHNILGVYGGEEIITGVGSVVQSQWTSIAQIFVAGTGGDPPFIFTWSQVTAPTQTAQPSTATPTSLSVDSTALTATGPAAIVAGRSATVTGRLTDTTLGAAVPSASLQFCHRAVTSAASSCAAVTTGTDGTVGLSVHPSVTTLYWFVYDGSAVLASAMSNQARVGVRPAVSLHATRSTLGWRLASHLTPVRGQTVRLQRATSKGWVTVRRVTARSWMTFTRLRAGTYRLTVSAVNGSLATSAKVHA
jgi:hypothetical protein